jgi:hypothetical protein
VTQGVRVARRGTERNECLDRSGVRTSTERIGCPPRSKPDQTRRISGTGILVAPNSWAGLLLRSLDRRKGGDSLR